MIHPTNPLPKQFDDLRTAIDGLVSGTFVSVSAWGAPGIGKSHTAETHLKKTKLRYEIFRNATMPAIVNALYEWRAGGLLLLDDADEMLLRANEAQFNLFKSATDQKSPQSRLIVRSTMSSRMDKIPSKFDTKCQILLLSNQDLLDASLYPASMRGLVPSLESRINRFLPFSNDPSHLLDYVTHLVVDQEIMRGKNYGGRDAKYIGRQKQADVLNSSPITRTIFAKSACARLKTWPVLPSTRRTGAPLPRNGSR